MKMNADRWKVVVSRCNLHQTLITTFREIQRTWSIHLSWISNIFYDLTQGQVVLSNLTTKKLSWITIQCRSSLLAFSLWWDAIASLHNSWGKSATTTWLFLQNCKTVMQNLLSNTDVTSVFFRLYFFSRQMRWVWSCKALSSCILIGFMYGCHSKVKPFEFLF